MSAEHNHPPRCCCPMAPDVDAFEPVHPCPACHEHGDLATPYTEQETTNG
jgi:hypothetical protein